MSPLRWWLPAAAAIVLGGAMLRAATPGDEDTSGINPHLIRLVRPPQRPLSALATVGKLIFFDRSLSASGQQSCASCHSPARSFGPPDDRDVQPGGPHMTQAGMRPPPSLAYLYRQTVFSIGPPIADYDNPPSLSQLVEQAKGVPRATKAAGTAPPPAAPVPQGGLFWDGRADSLMLQAMGPMINPVEMANKDVAAVAHKLELAGYVARLEPLFGRTVVNNPAMLAEEAMSAVARYQIEDTAFHRFDSKYDYWLEGKVRLTRAEMRGMQLFNDPAKGDCAACHISQPSPDGLPPLFTDTEYEALGVPRNRRLAVNRDPHFHDLGLCGPLRKNLAQQTQYCGMFLTPTLRNAAKRGVYFHNGVYHRLIDVLRFYAFRDTEPGKVYPHDAHGHVMEFDDLPRRYWANIDTADAPFDRKFGEKPALTESDMSDIAAFLSTLSDGYTLDRMQNRR